MTDVISAWIRTLRNVTESTAVTSKCTTRNLLDDQSRATLGGPMTLDEGVQTLRKEFQYLTTARGGRLILLGNGGSLAIASHMATDFALVGWPSIALTDFVALTSHTNDFGAEANFSKQLELMKLDCVDAVIAMSCSGKSPNVLEAVKFANSEGAYTVTFSGFLPDNPLRDLGILNFYVPAEEYGFVQLAHESILHAACDIQRGWHGGGQ
jgi:D-sedoheptulose 7-phosphate isomerase